MLCMTDIISILNEEHNTMLKINCLHSCFKNVAHILYLSLCSSVCINTTSLPFVLSTDRPTQMEPTFIGEKYKFWFKNTASYCPPPPPPKKKVTKMCSSLTIPFLNILKLCYFAQPQIKFPVTLHDIVYKSCAF